MNISNAWLAALGVGLLVACGNAAAQGQPIGNGIYACDGAAQAGPCQPEGDDDSSHSGGDGYTDNDYAHAEPKWETRWGAIADDGNGTAGVVAALRSKRDAEQSAISECRKRGGGACKLVFAYYNQCAAIAAGNGGSTTARAETKELAIQDSMQACERERGDCRVYYAGCSLPERVQ
jgi:hypothetical protein